MKRLVLLITALTLLATPARASEDETPALCTGIQEVDVPCHGALFAPELAKEALSCMKTELPLCQLQAGFDRELCELHDRRLEAELSIERRVSKNYSNMLETYIDMQVPEATPFYKEGWFTFGTGLVLGATLVAIVSD